MPTRNHIPAHVVDVIINDPYMVGVIDEPYAMKVAFTRGLVPVGNIVNVVVVDD